MTGRLSSLPLLFKREAPSYNLKLAQCLSLGLIASIAYAGALELAQLLTPDRQARFADFEWNALAITLALVAPSIFLFGADYD